VIAKRTRKNRINFLHNPDGTHSATQEQIAQTLNNYFIDIFATNRTHMDVTSSSLEPPLATGATTQPQHQEDDRAFTDSKPTMEELQQIIKTMRNGASPGPDGLNAKFYKHTWPWIASDVYKLVIDFYNTALIQPELNQTFLVLLPKKTQSVTPKILDPSASAMLFTN